MKNSTLIRIKVPKALYESALEKALLEAAGKDPKKVAADKAKAEKEAKAKKEKEAKDKKEKEAKAKKSIKEADVTAAQAGLQTITDLFGGMNPQAVIAALAALPATVVASSQILSKLKQKAAAARGKSGPVSEVKKDKLKDLKK